MNQPEHSKEKKTIFSKIKLGLLFLPAILIFLPANFFDNGQTVCISKLLLNVECFGCGMTRAIQHAIHLEFKTAYQYNKLVVIVLPLLLYVYFQEMINFSKKGKNNQND